MSTIRRSEVPTAQIGIDADVIDHEVGILISLTGKLTREPNMRVSKTGKKNDPSTVGSHSRTDPPL
jgi:hypothetical protein